MKFTCEWIDRKKKDIPYGKDVLVIWKGRFGILNRDEEKGNFCAMCPEEFSGITEMDEECFSKIDYWCDLPIPIFRCDYVQ
jgi:hypothetical protein